MRCVPLLLLAIGVCSTSAAGDLYVVVNARNPTQALTHRDVVSLFTGRLRSFPGDGPAQAYDQAASSAAREQFYKTLTGMDLARVNSYWARLQFTGTVSSPQKLSDDEDVIARLSTDPQGIGYLTQAPQHAALRVVYVVHAGGEKEEAR